MIEKTDETASLEELVAAIRRLPSNPEAIEPARGSLAAALAAQPDDLSFDLQTWLDEWALVEEELQRIEDEDAVRDTGQ